MLPLITRAYALLEVKAAARTDGRRIITGIASTPAPDRSGDIVEPLGATYASELPLLLHHRAETPVGIARLDPPTTAGITFEAELPVIEEDGAVKTEVDRAWHSIVHGLIKAVSIGYRAQRTDVEKLKSGGLRFLKSEICELSLVTVPANQHASLAVVKQLDAENLAALGLPLSSGAADALPIVRAKAAPAMKQTITEQITTFTETRRTKAERMVALMTKAAEDSSTLDEADTAEYDGLDREVQSIDAHLTRLKALEKINIETARPVAQAAAEQQQQQQRPVITVVKNVPPGIGFTRYAMALVAGRGSRSDAIRYAEEQRHWMDQTPEVVLALKAAVAPGTTTDPAWAKPLVPTYRSLADEFLELVRPATILGKIPNLRRVPFNVAIPTQTAGGAYNWVGENAPKPVTKLGFGSTKVESSKAAGIIVITEELARSSTPAAEEVVKRDMVAGITKFLDEQFTDPAVAYVAGVHPASITNGIAAIPSSGATPANAATDLNALVRAFVAAGESLSGAVLLLSEQNAFALAQAKNPLGQPLYPSLGVAGGQFDGFSVITSETMKQLVVLMQPRDVLLADDGGIEIDVSREASLDMDSAPAGGATMVPVSLWQNNLVGIRAERFIAWARAREIAVQYISGAAYTA